VGRLLGTGEGRCSKTDKWTEERGSNWALNLGLCNEQQGLVAGSALLCCCLMLGLAEGKESKKYHLFMCFWRACGLPLLPLGQSSQFQEVKEARAT
jgi:hypothetical protein